MRSKRNRHKSRRKRGRGANKKMLHKRKTRRGRREQRLERHLRRHGHLPPRRPLPEFLVYEDGEFFRRSTDTWQPPPEEEERPGWLHRQRALALFPRGPRVPSFLNRRPLRVVMPMPPPTPLPTGWREVQDKEGATYYWNTITNATQWRRPSPPWRSLPATGTMAAAAPSAAVAPAAIAPFNRLKFYRLIQRGLNEGEEGVEARKKLATRLHELRVIERNPDGSDLNLTQKNVRALMKVWGQQGRQGAQGIPASQLPNMLSGWRFEVEEEEDEDDEGQDGGSRRRHKRRRKTRRRRRLPFGSKSMARWNLMNAPPGSPASQWASKELNA